MERKENPVLHYFKHHPQLAITVGYLLMVFLGIAYKYSLSKKMGINVLEFSGISDLLMAPIRKPILIGWWLFLMALIYLFWALNSKLEKNKALFKKLHFGIDIQSKSWYPFYTWIAFGFLVLFYTFLAGQFSASGEVRAAKKGKGEQYVVLAGDAASVETTGFLIDKTESAYFLYDTSAKHTLVLNDNRVLRLMHKGNPTETAETAIRRIMSTQERDWNAGDLEAFMQGYWHSDSLCFIGSRGLTYGWQQTLDNYKKGYPDKAAMGTLKFSLKKIEQTSTSTAFVIGAWHLTRPEKGDLSGHFTLFWRKIKGEWVIVADHSS